MTLRLTIELVPATAFGQNLRNMLSQKEWNGIAKQVYAKAGHLCEICGGRGNRHPVECHETWSYHEQEEEPRQALTGLAALCPFCHEVKHIGRARAVGNGPRALAHLQLINAMSRADAEKYVRLEFEVWRRRTEQSWRLDLGNILERYEIDASSVTRRAVVEARRFT